MTYKNTSNDKSLRAQLAALPSVAGYDDLPQGLRGYYFKRALYAGYTRTLIGAALVSVYHYERATSWRYARDNEEAGEVLEPGDWLDERARSLDSSTRRRRAAHPSAGLLDLYKNPSLVASPWRTGGEIDLSAELLERAFIALAEPGYTPSTYQAVGADGYGDSLLGDAGDRSRSPSVLYAERFTPSVGAVELVGVPFVCLAQLLLVAQSFAEHERASESRARKARGCESRIALSSIDFLRGDAWRAVAARVGLASSAARAPSDPLGYVTIPRIVRGSRAGLGEWREEEGGIVAGRLVMDTPAGGRLTADRDGMWQRCNLPGWGGSEVGGERDRISAQRAAQRAYFAHFDAWRVATGRIVEP